jgi:branched-chain amino acid transport system substrate-binding protein
MTFRLLLRCLPLLALLAAPAAWAGGGSDLNIGFVGRFSGADGRASQDALDGFRLGVKHLGGRLATVEFTLTVIDAHSDEEGLRSALARLSSDARSQVVLLAGSPADARLAVPQVAGSKAFLISLTAPATPLAAKECSSYYFSLAGLLDTGNELAGQYLQGQGYRRVLLAGPPGPVAKAAADAFRRSFKGEVTEVTSRRGEMSFTSDLRRIREAKPDAVYLLHTGGMAVNFILQYAEIGLKGEVPLYGPATTFDQTTLAAVGPAAADLFSVGPWSEDLDTPASHRMMSDFEAEYGRPASSAAAQGYDAAMLLDAAVHQVEKKFNDDDALRNALRKVDFPSTRGTLKFDSNHFPIQNYVLRQAVQDARGRMANEQRGLVAPAVRDGHAAECPMRWINDPLPPPKG